MGRLAGARPLGALNPAANGRERPPKLRYADCSCGQANDVCQEESVKTTATTLSVLALLLQACGNGADESGASNMSGGGGGGGQATACAYVEHTRTACRGYSSVRNSYNYDRCRDNVSASDCLRNRPSRPDENTSDCYRNYSYTDVSFRGTCEHWRKYWSEERDAQGRKVVECLLDRHCPMDAGGRCVNFHCDCGAHACPQPQPPSP